MQYRRVVVFSLPVMLAGLVFFLSLPAGAQGTGQGVIHGTVFRETVSRDFLQEPGEPGVPGLTVELWNTTSLTGRPTRLQSTQTDAQGQYRFTVDSVKGPRSDFGCYEVHLVLLSGINSQLVMRSPPICTVTAGGEAEISFPLPGGVTTPPVMSQGTIQGTVFRDTNGSGRADSGEPAVAGATVELWNTTSFTGQPTRLQSTQTDAQGRYRFLVNPLNGPAPDFGCYEVRLTLPADLGGGCARSQQVCQVTAGATIALDFPLPGGTGANHAPSIVYIRVEPSGAPPGGTVRLEALGLDVDDDRLTYQWSLSAGSFTDEEGPLIDWTAPSQPGDYPIRVVATDPSGLSASAQVVVKVTSAGVEFNSPPLVEDVLASVLTPSPGQQVRLTVRASDPDGDPVSNLFYFLGGARGARVGPTEVIWEAPSRPAIYSTYAVVSDGRGGFGWRKRELSVNSAQALDRSHPSYGKAGQALIDSFGYLLWVGINDPAVAQQAAALAAGNSQRWVLGRVVPDSRQRHAFYLDPATISLAEVTAEGIQTTVEQVSRRPAYYAPGGAGGFNAWAISGRLIQFVPAP